MATTLAASYNGTPSLGSSIFIEIRDALTGAILTARTHTGIREDVAGMYAWSGIVTDALIYEAVWDENTGVFYGGVTGPLISAPAVLAATNPATTNPLTFTIKRGDTDPSIVVQALVVDPADASAMIPWPIPVGSAVKFTMRDSADFASRTRTAFTPATPKVHATASIDDALNGIMSYGWAVGDTDTDGLFRAEFEVTSGSEIRTFPVGVDDTRNWIAVTIVDDLDPGITP